MNRTREQSHRRDGAADAARAGSGRGAPEALAVIRDGGTTTTSTAAPAGAASSSVTVDQLAAILACVAGADGLQAGTLENATAVAASWRGSIGGGKDATGDAVAALPARLRLLYDLVSGCARRVVAACEDAATTRRAQPETRS